MNFKEWKIKEYYRIEQNKTRFAFVGKPAEFTVCLPLVTPPPMKQNSAP